MRWAVTWPWVFVLLVQAMPERWQARMQANVPRLRELVSIATAIADASDTAEDAAALSAISWYESGHTVRARGKLGEVGPFQLMPPAPKELGAQAREALRRLHTQHWAGYTGERGRCPCPLAEHRWDLAAKLLAAP